MRKLYTSVGVLGLCQFRIHSDGADAPLGLMRGPRRGWRRKKNAISLHSPSQSGPNACQVWL